MNKETKRGLVWLFVKLLFIAFCIVLMLVGSFRSASIDSKYTKLLEEQASLQSDFIKVQKELIESERTLNLYREQVSICDSPEEKQPIKSVPFKGLLAPEDIPFTEEEIVKFSPDPGR